MPPFFEISRNVHSRLVSDKEKLGRWFDAKGPTSNVGHFRVEVSVMAQNKLSRLDILESIQELLQDELHYIVTHGSYTYTELKQMYYMDFYAVLRRVSEDIKRKNKHGRKDRV